MSIDAKANVEVGDFSREGRGRGAEAVAALDHEMMTKQRVVPFGILEVASGALDVTMGTSAKTSDFVVDCLEAWWAKMGPQHPLVTELVIDTDGGPETNGQRTQFLARMVGFSRASGLRIRLVYYPPYHSKYNPIERCWAAMEKHWNATLLSDIDTVVEWASTMTWKGVHPVVALTTTVYEKGVRVAKAAMREVERFITRNPLLPKWDLLIDPAQAG